MSISPAARSRCQQGRAQVRATGEPTGSRKTTASERSEETGREPEGRVRRTALAKRGRNTPASSRRPTAISRTPRPRAIRAPREPPGRPESGGPRPRDHGVSRTYGASWARSWPRPTAAFLGSARARRLSASVRRRAHPPPGGAVRPSEPGRPTGWVPGGDSDRGNSWKVDGGARGK